MKILLVDDDAFLRDMYTMKFKDNGDEVDVAKDAKEALEILETKTYDVVVSDMIIPGMDGISFLTAMQENPELASVTKIILSNQSEEGDKQAAKKAGAHGYLVKADLIPSEVVKQVAEIYQQQQ